MVPVDEADDAEDESSSGRSAAVTSGRSEKESSASSCSSSGMGGGMLASLAFAKDRWRSLMAVRRWGAARGVGGGGGSGPLLTPGAVNNEDRLQCATVRYRKSRRRGNSAHGREGYRPGRTAMIDLSCQTNN